MKVLRCFPALALLAMAILPLRAQEYLFDDMPPPDEASELPTPFTQFTGIDGKIPLDKSSREPFISDAALSVQPRFYYRSVRNAQGVQDTFAGGGSMGLTTGWWKDAIQFGVMGYMTQPLVAVKANNRSGLVESDGSGFFTLGQAWARLRVGPATATAYRQILSLPFINANDARMIPNTFEAYQVEVKGWEIFRFNAGYITQMKGRNTPDFVPMSEAAGAPDLNRGTSFVGVMVSKEDGPYLGVENETTWDLFSNTYVQAGHTWQVTEGLQLRGDVQFVDQRSVGGEAVGSFESQLYGARLASSYGGAVLSFSYTGMGGTSGLFSPFGADPGFNRLMISNFAQKSEQAVGASLSYDFGRVGLRGVTAFASYVYGALPDEQWEHEFNVTCDYRINEGLLKNFWLRLRYAHNEMSGQVPIEDFRVILNYALAF